MTDAADRVAVGVRTGVPILRYGTLLAVLLVAVLLSAGCAGTTAGRATGGAGVDGAPGAPGLDGADGSDTADGSPGTGSPGNEGNEPVTGSGNLVSRQLGVSGVTTLLVGAGFVVQVTIGEPETATIRMDDNLTELVDAAVRGDRLSLGLTPGAGVRNATLSAEVTLRDLDRLTVDGAGQVTLVSELAGDALDVDVSGASQVTGPVRVDRLVAAVSGTSVLALAGQAGHLQLRGSGTSALRLSELAVQDLDVVLSGAGCAAVAVSGTLAAQASGASMLRYRGAPRITRQQTSGASSIAAESPAAGAPLGDRCGP